MNKAQELLGTSAVYFEEWQYETRGGDIGRIRRYFGGTYTAAIFDNAWSDESWTDVAEYTGLEGIYQTHIDAYNHLGFAIAIINAPDHGVVLREAGLEAWLGETVQ